MKNALALDILCVGGGGKILPTGDPFSFSPQNHNSNLRALEYLHGGRGESVRVNFRLENERQQNSNEISRGRKVSRFLNNDKKLIY